MRCSMQHLQTFTKTNQQCVALSKQPMQQTGRGKPAAPIEDANVHNSRRWFSIFQPGLEYSCRKRLVWRIVASECGAVGGCCMQHAFGFHVVAWPTYQRTHHRLVSGARSRWSFGFDFRVSLWNFPSSSYFLLDLIAVAVKVKMCASNWPVAHVTWLNKLQ